MAGSRVRLLGWWAAVIVYAGFLFFLSSLSLPLPLPFAPGVGLDKVAHLGAYGLLSYLLFRALHISFPHAALWRIALAAAVLATLYGASDEAHQLYVPNRQAEILDLVADGIGAFLASGICWVKRNGA
ncbi:MAG: VanZ family protein [Nitrospirae bacterium]|nr:VanZ family protein [Nitrospirota bacterium]